MKKTEYFTSQVSWNEGQQGVLQVVAKKNDFLKQNDKNIAKIDHEDIKITYLPGGNLILFTLLLTYYPKK